MYIPNYCDDLSFYTYAVILKAIKNKQMKNQLFFYCCDAIIGLKLPYFWLVSGLTGMIKLLRVCATWLYILESNCGSTNLSNMLIITTHI